MSLYRHEFPLTVGMKTMIFWLSAPEGLSSEGGHPVKLNDAGKTGFF
jgi:hypothetical protein